MAISLGGAVSVNITGILESWGFPYFSSNLIHDNKESLDEVPEDKNNNLVYVIKIHRLLKMSLLHHCLHHTKYSFNTTGHNNNIGYNIEKKNTINITLSLFFLIFLF